jgi:hypothetical protein
MARTMTEIKLDLELVLARIDLLAEKIARLHGRLRRLDVPAVPG